MKLSTLSAAVAATLALSACGGMELERTSGMTPTGSEFDKALFSDYMTLSHQEYNEGDYRNSDLYAMRARSAGAGTMVEPEEISARTIPANETQELSSARGRLVTALNGGARARDPREAASAQANFECWMEEAEENIQPQHLAECRSRFFDALGKIEVKPAVAAAPAPAPVLQPENIAIYFDLNKATLNDEAQREIDHAVARIRGLRAKEVVLVGHADRSGSARYNMALSERRVTAVRDALKKAGVDVPFSESAVGESRPAVPTADNVRERRNREVTVHIVPGDMPRPTPMPETHTMTGHGA